MGCVQSRKDINDVHPNIFRVVNVDESGCNLWSGQLEVTDTELILYRRGKTPTRWPLRSLRRYGFDAHTFSFESGRRCTTGQGIYAFKCRRAEQLFGTLQQSIQVRNMDNENVLESFTNGNLNRPPNTLPRPPIDQRPTSFITGEYLEPSLTIGNTGIPIRFAEMVRLGSVSSGPLSPEIHSPGSPSSSNILEVMPLAPLPVSSANHQVTNLYQMQEFSFHREHNNNQKSKCSTSEHSYLNTRGVNADLAALRRTLYKRPVYSDEESNVDMNELKEANSATVNSPVPMSPTLSVNSEYYATLSVDQEANRLYMNIAPGEMPTGLPAIREEPKIPLYSNHSMPATSPMSATPSSVRLKTFDFHDTARFELEEERHNYANLKPGEINYDPRLLMKQNSLSRNPIENNTHNEVVTEINYAEIDLEKPKSDDENSKPLPSTSQKEPTIGYTTIDFDKTAALTLVAQGTEVDTEGSRKTRHNSTALPPSPTVT